MRITIAPEFSCLGFVCLLLAVSSGCASVTLGREFTNNRPIIGVLTQPTYGPEYRYGQEYVSATYVRYLEMAGARVVPVRGLESFDYYQALFYNINGVLFPGGSSSLSSGPYLRSASLLYQMALNAKAEGEYFPIWGTCLGFELLTELTARQNLLRRTNTSDTILPLIFTPGFNESRLFRDAPTDMIENLTSKPITQNNHIMSLLVEDFENSQPLSNFYRVISTSISKDGEEFVSTLEAKDYPFYATQWHPEKSIFLWRTDKQINHSYQSIQVSQYMANFFVNEARKNDHHFYSPEDEAHAVIGNAFRMFKPDFAFGEKFYFNYTQR